MLRNQAILVVVATFLVAYCVGQGSFVGLFKEEGIPSCQVFIYSLEDENLENFTLPVRCDRADIGFSNLQVTDNIDSRLFVSIDLVTILQINLNTGNVEASYDFTDKGRIDYLRYSDDYRKLFVLWQNLPYATIDPATQQISYAQAALPTPAFSKTTGYQISFGTDSNFYLVSYDVATGAILKKDTIQFWTNYNPTETGIVDTCYDTDEDVLYVHVVNYPSEAASLNNSKLVLVDPVNASATLFTTIPHPGGKNTAALLPFIGSCNYQDNSYLFASFANPKALPTVAISLDDQNPLTYSNFNLRALTRVDSTSILSIGWITEN